MELKVKLFADGAEKLGMLEMYNNPLISGFTTNPTLMKIAGVKNYKEFAKDILQSISDRPISFEVFSDDLNEMEDQAMEIASWGSNVNVKIPITNTKGLSCENLITKLSSEGVKTNVTAMMTVDQVKKVLHFCTFALPKFVDVKKCKTKCFCLYVQFMMRNCP